MKENIQLNLKTFTPLICLIRIDFPSDTDFFGVVVNCNRRGSDDDIILFKSTSNRKRLSF